MVEIDRFEKARRLMYTQCPECSSAFRVTADILKKAAGKVRCGGCGQAFNALEFLSETMPKQPPKAAAEEALPELKPEPMESDGRVPKSISAEQSAALLKTLDGLAGSDVRIEDTGVEWRVLDEDELGEAAGDPVAIPGDDASPGENQIEVDELRFDDNTPLPDGFDLEGDFSGEAFQSRQSENPAEKVPEADVASEDITEATAADIDLSDPNEWTDILDEFEGIAEVVAPPPDAETETGSEDSQAFDQADMPGEDDNPEAEEQPLDVDTQFALQAEAMGIDLTGTHDVTEESESEDTPDVDKALEESTDDEREHEDLAKEDLVDEVDEAAQLDFIGDDDEDADEIPQDANEYSDEETEQEELKDDSGNLDDELDEAMSSLEQVADAVAEDEEPEDKEAEEEEPEDEEPEEEELEDEEPEEEDSEEEEPEDEQPEEEDSEEEEPEDEQPEEEEPEDEEPEDQEPADETDDSSKHDEIYVPPMTEEEQTINMQIDHELLAVATEDEEGLSTTVLVADVAAEGQADDRKDVNAEDEQALMDTSAGFETIIMEGEFVRTAVDREKLAADAAAAADTLAQAAAAEQRKVEKAARAARRRRGIIGGIVVLILLLGAQVLHQSREKLATIPAFNNAVGPMYRAMGKPLSPEWDVAGWRFEATKGSTDEGDENLTIYSRIGNKSDKPLPYPLVAVSLTDRFEETVGSRILDPVDYLSGDLDPRKLVQPGSNFNAVITVRSPAATVTGFKLNVCYRESGGQLRCAIDDFK